MAVTSAAAFASSTTAGYTVRTTPTTSVLAGATDSLASPAIDTSVNSIENKKIVCGIDIKADFTDNPAHFDYQLSHNGTDWTADVQISSDGAPAMTAAGGPYLHILDLADVYAPYVRFVWNTNGATLGTSGTMQFFFAYK